MLRALRVPLLLVFLGLVAAAAGMAWFALSPIRLPAASVDFSIASGKNNDCNAKGLVSKGGCA
jgi:hypothetical protein